MKQVKELQTESTNEESTPHNIFNIYQPPPEATVLIFQMFQLSDSVLRYMNFGDSKNVCFRTTFCSFLRCLSTIKVISPTSCHWRRLQLHLGFKSHTEQDLHRAGH